MWDSWDIDMGQTCIPLVGKKLTIREVGDFFSRPKGCDENESTCGFYQRTWHMDAQGMIPSGNLT